MDSYRVISLVGEDVHIVVPISDKEVVLEGAVCDRDLDDIGGARKLLDSNSASSKPGLDLGVLVTVAVVLDPLGTTW